MTNAKSNPGADESGADPRTQQDFDLAFQDITAQIPDLSHPSVSGGGPRDWSPAPLSEAEETFDPTQLPQPAARPTPLAVRLSFVAAVALLLLCVLSWVGTIALPVPLIACCAIGGFAAVIAGIWFSSPQTREEDDDGARL